MDHLAHQQSGNNPFHSLVRRSEGPAPLADVAVSGWQVDATRHLGDAPPLSAGNVRQLGQRGITHQCKRCSLSRLR